MLFHRMGCFAIATFCVSAITQADEETIGDFLRNKSLNAVIVVTDMNAATDFYGGVLGLEPMSDVIFRSNTAPVFFEGAVTMKRFRVGNHEIKLIPGKKTTKKFSGGSDNAIGFRMINFPMADMEAFLGRLEAKGIAKPQIHEFPGNSYRFGMIKDPDGNQVEFHFYEGPAPENWTENIHYALNVSDVEATRKFYREVLGYTELSPVPLPGDPEKKVYLFALGPTVVKFWSYGKDLPNQAGRHDEAYGFRYIQYDTKDVHAAHAWLVERGAKVEMPPTPVISMPVDIMFAADPDRIIHELFGVVLPSKN